jgi:hypothetical protein
VGSGWSGAEKENGTMPIPRQKGFASNWSINRKFNPSLSGSECSQRRTKESCMLVIMPRIIPDKEIAGLGPQ